MKKFLSAIFLYCLSFWIISCNSGGNKDSVDKADSSNEKKSDSSSANPNATMPVDKGTSEFMVKAADGGMMEVDLGKVAGDKARNKRVKNFGEMMVTDHTKANDELKSLASQKNVTLPSAVGTDHQKHIDELNKKSGADFDKSYMKMMVDDHQEDIKEFEEDSSKTNDADVKAWVTKTLPVLRKHLDSARAVRKTLK